MRNSTYTLLFLLSQFTFSLTSSSQKTESSSPAARVRCGSMEALEMWFNQNPAARQEYLRNVEQGKNMAEAAKDQINDETHRPGAIVYIPVVVHLVLGSADQARVTKADVLWQINKLNEDYAGINADSTNASNFYGIRGHSQIQFCLAQRDANGNPTDGINRVYSTITDFSPATVGSLKHANTCGADAWNPDKYFNIWVGRSTSLLGIATFPQTGAANEQGVAIALDGFSNNPSYVNPAFALGRTLVHESGHYFGLYHNWGDDGTACTGDDFRQVPGTCLLPAALLLGDTPNQAGATGGCPSGVRTDACSPASPGFNYQNYMDYTDDACYSMFTQKQVERAEYILNNCRASLLTSDGCSPVTVFANDASPIIMSPGNSCFPGGIGSNFCSNSIFNASVMVKNAGTANLTSVTLSAAVGTGAATSATFTVNLAPFASTIVTINGINIGSAGGAQTLKIYSSNPNNVADQRLSNDTASISINVLASGGGATTINEGFEATSFPPTAWSVINPNSGSITWVRNTAGKNSGLASAYINYFSYSTTGHLDHLVLPIFDATDADSVVLEFSRAYKRYAAGATFSDTLMVQMATQCGATSFPITAWKKGGNDLSTSPGTNTGNWVPVAADWARERIELKSFIPAGVNSVTVAFTGKNGYGQNLYLDDVNLRKVQLIRRDAMVFSIPTAKQCFPTFIPTVSIRSNGKDTLVSARVVYRITGPSSFSVTDSVNWTGSLITGAIAVVPLKQVTLGNTGVYTLRAYTKLPNGLEDQLSSNDTLSANFTLVSTLPAPVFEGFETTTFPPPNWTRLNADAQGTWFRTTAARYSGVGSAVVDNYNYNANGTNDDLESPVISYSGIDSAYISFRLSHATYLYPGSTQLPMDTLMVLVTKDCGQTFTPVYKKWGIELQTVNNPNAPFTDIFVPSSTTQWRLERIDLTSAFGSGGIAQLVIRNKGNFGNTMLVDDILITTKTLPPKLKQNGYMIAPNPFNSSFIIQHYLPPVNLRGIQVVNTAGQVVHQTEFNGNALSNIKIDLSRYAAGVYLVKMVYNEKVITERIIKTQ